MALNPRDVPITRDDVATWLRSFKRQKKYGTVEEYVRHRVEALKLPDTQVNISARDDIKGDTVDIVDLIIMDLPSYGTT